MRTAKLDPQSGLEAEKKERARIRRERVEEAFKALQTVLHEVEGTQSGAYGTHEMQVAGMHMETAWLWAREALEE